MVRGCVPNTHVLLQLRAAEVDMQTTPQEESSQHSGIHPASAPTGLAGWLWDPVPRRPCSPHVLGKPSSWLCWPWCHHRSSSSASETQSLLHHLCSHREISPRLQGPLDERRREKLPPMSPGYPKKAPIPPRQGSFSSSYTTKPPRPARGASTHG